MPSIKRKLIAKDLLNSERYHWFGRSEFLWYDVLKVDSVTDLRVIPSGVKVNGITSITGDTKECKYRLMDLCVLSAELNESSLEDTRFLSDLSLLFGEDATEPRSDWELNRKLVVSDVRFPSYITASFWNNEVRSPKLPSLTLNEQQKFKIVQLADLHFSVGKGTCRDEFPAHGTCEADPKTLQFIDQVLDIEKPQLVVFTGDQIMGDECKQDSETALLKALAPVIAREIPWTVVWGNHDDEGSLSRWQLSEFAKKLPYSLFEIGPSDTKDNQFGVGNYVIEVQGSHGKTKIALYFLDSHKYSQSKAFPGYDWIKEDQWKYMEGYQANHESIKLAQNSGDLLSMAFFHIPLPEYTDFPPEAGSNRVIGSYKEGITAPKYNSEGLKTLHKLGVTVTSVGHDHCNDYCLLNEADDGKDKIWLCYGGGTGEGGYGGYGGTERRIRIFEIDALKKDIHSWKRLNGSPENTFDSKILVSDGVPYTA
ncbi:unnamed protein product [Kluyveromyces dobzhanskii CBS 2104]|uniref:WGS project CCBQ000000000 data, contig 00015 n=1 Tax=Kluyveromyces dobzhanskii CBS 2104 TaxID=1427455 RepID=A0A0A8LA41_9SACH|nr:unnamed protein product [Kluyveromyces dobzhanskii CBS 2104]